VSFLQSDKTVRTSEEEINQTVRTSEEEINQTDAHKDTTVLINKDPSNPENEGSTNAKSDEPIDHVGKQEMSNTVEKLKNFFDEEYLKTKPDEQQNECERWNPMQDHFESTRNVYTFDEENVEDVVCGYREFCFFLNSHLCCLTCQPSNREKSSSLYVNSF
jgi:hypothetical protein